MMFFGGSVGAIYRQFAVTLVLTILFSVLMAMTLTPALCAALLQNSPGHEMVPTKGLLGWFNRFFAQDYATLQEWRHRRGEAYRPIFAALRRLAGGTGMVVHTSADQFPAGRRPRAISSTSSSCRRVPRASIAGGAVASGAVLSQAAGSGACHRRAGFFFLRPWAECSTRLRASQGLGRAARQG